MRAPLSRLDELERFQSLLLAIAIVTLTLLGFIDAARS